MHKKKEYVYKKKEFMYNIESEYNLFKSNMLLKTPEEIYDSCNTIRFYECMYEYFQYNENINSQFISYMHCKKNTISELQHIYYKNEYLTVDTWDGIDDIINYCMMD